MKKRKLKVLLLSLMMAIGLMVPSTGHAQNDQFFKNGEDLYNNRADAGGSLTNQTFGNSGYSLTNQTFGSNGYNLTNQTFGAPLGSGLLIMVMAGVGYAIVKKNEKE